MECFVYGIMSFVRSLNHHHQALIVVLLQLLCLVFLSRLILSTSSIKLFPESAVAVVQGSAGGAAAAAGRWELLLENAGIASMHTAVTHTNTVLLLDRRNVGSSNISLARDQQSINGDSSAHSVIFSLTSNSVRPLTIFTDTWCSSGQFLADGTLVQTGGNLVDNSAHMIRTFTPCEADGVCDWVEIDSEQLVDGRWYATNQLLPDGMTSIVIGGHRVSSYEYIPKDDVTTWQLRLLENGDENRLYPFVHLLPDGNLFVFANRDSILLDYETNTVLRTFPTMPGFVARNYPASGSSVLLPLDITSDSSATTVTILICGGARPDAHRAPNLLEIPASDSCGLLTVGTTRDTVDTEQWVMLVMPRRRVMGDMLLLPDGQVLIINGAMNGTAGWEDATAPCLQPVIFNPVNASFHIQAATSRPRMYHSTANLLPDGRVLVAGSNTHVRYNFKAEFPTDVSLEVFLPNYLANSEFDASRPTFSRTQPPTTLNYGKNFRANIYLPEAFTKTSAPANDEDPGGRNTSNFLELRLCNAPYTTHSLSMGQRQLRLPILQSWQPRTDRNNIFTVESMAPPTANLAPPGYYMLFPLYQSIPGAATWVQLS